MNPMQLTARVANPKLTLYAFHLRNNLAQGSQKPVDNVNHLWEQCQIIGQKLGVPRLESLLERLQDSNGEIGVPPSQDHPQSDYLELLATERLLHFSAIPHGGALQLRGEVYPLQIHDTYAVDITLRYPNTTVEIAQLNGLNPQGCLLPNQIQASLGQFLVLFAQPVGEIENDQAFADACIAALLPESEAKQYLLSPPTKGQFLGSPIFEYDNGQDNPAQHCQILVWLNRHPQTETLEEEGDYYQPLINLLCCRSKILYAYNQSRWCNNQVRLLYETLETKVKDFRQLASNQAERLQQLKEWLTDIPQLTFEYACQLRDLEVHRTTIETNAKNYRFWLEKLQEISIKDSDNLEFWQHFIIKRTENKLVEQIRVDLAYLTPGRQLFEEMIATIRGIVEIEQAESDRSLQNTVAIVGVGLAAAAIGATVAPYVIPTEPRQPILLPFSTSYLHPMTQSLLLSLFFGFAGAVVTKGFTYLTQKRGAIIGHLTKIRRGGNHQTAALSMSPQVLPESRKHK